MNVPVALRVLLAAFGLVVPLSIAAQGRWTPARLASGQPPPIPVLAVAGGEVFLELTVTTGGSVGRIEPLRTSPPFTDAVVNVVRTWRFRPAERARAKTTGRPPAVGETVTELVESKVLVAAIYRPPALFGPTLGTPPRTVATASNEVAFPLSTTTPGFPPLAYSDGTVLIEVVVGADGRVADATVRRSAAGFDEAALDAVRQWTFRPARIDGRWTASYAYAVMAFRQPVTIASPPIPPRR